MHLQYNLYNDSGVVPGRFTLIRTAPAVELLLLVLVSCYLLFLDPFHLVFLVSVSAAIGLTLIIISKLGFLNFFAGYCICIHITINKTNK